MLKHIKSLVVTGMAAVMVVFALAPVTVAVSPADEIQKGVNGSGAPDSSKGEAGLKGALKTIVDILLFIVGAISVIMIIVGGLRYVLSGGDSNQVSAAKNTILYAVVGLIVSILAYSIVNWVLQQF